MALVVGTVVLIRYDGHDQWHERLILFHIDGAEYLIVTPDWDIYPEVLSRANPDIDGIRLYRLDNNGLAAAPAGVGNVHAFAPLSAEDRAGLFREGRELGEQELADRGLPRRVGGPVPRVVPGLRRPRDVQPNARAAAPAAAAGGGGGAGVAAGAAPAGGAGGAAPAAESQRV